MQSVLKLKKSNCKNCHRCIRRCPVKAIRFTGHQAHIISDECILCGQCFVVCPQDAHPFIKNHADYITTLPGGHGAFRELCDLILIAKGIMTADGGFVDERY